MLSLLKILLFCGVCGVLMLLLCAAATAAVHFATLEGQVTPCDIRSTTYMHYVTLTEEAFWGQRYWDLV